MITALNVSVFIVVDEYVEHAPVEEVALAGRAHELPFMLVRYSTDLSPVVRWVNHSPNVSLAAPIRGPDRRVGTRMALSPLALSMLRDGADFAVGDGAG